MSLFGQRVLRTEDARMLTSGGTYVADVRHPLLDGCVYVHFVRSTHAHARLTSVETADALTVAGVLAVYTGVDVDIGRERRSARSNRPATGVDARRLAAGTHPLDARR